MMKIFHIFIMIKQMLHILRILKLKSSLNILFIEKCHNQNDELYYEIGALNVVLSSFLLDFRFGVI